MAAILHKEPEPLDATPALKTILTRCLRKSPADRFQSMTQVKEALLAAIKHYDADAMIIGRSPRPGFQGRLRDLTYAIVRDSPVPVISV